MTGEPPLLALHGITRAYGRLRALENLDLEFRDGETVALFGPNGAGKTTLLRIASTLLTPSRGHMLYRGRPLDRTMRAEYRRRTGLVGHATFLYDDLSAEENLLLHARLRGVSDAATRVRELLHQVGLWERRGDRVGHFSRGMQQRLSLARSLVSPVELLLLDEPFSGLDGPGSEVLVELLARRQEAGSTTVFSSHDLSRGLALASRYLLLERGRLRTSGPCLPYRDLPSRQLTLERLAAGAA